MRIFIAIALLALAGCSALGGIPDTAINALANAGGGCVTAQGMWGSATMLVGSADKGVIRNGEVTVAGGCGGITIRDAATVRAVPPVPGTVTTITVPGFTTTTVAPATGTPQRTP